MFDLGGTVTAHDCNCRCYLEYSLMTAEEFAKATGKYVANDGNGDIIKENGNKAITKITDNAIEKVPKVDIPGFTDEQSIFIQQQHKELLKYARDNNDNFDLKLFKTEWDRLIKKEKGKINYDKVIAKILSKTRAGVIWNERV